MEIYIESFLLQNILINFCLLKLVHLTTKTQTNFFKTFTASIIGAVPSVMIVLFLNNTLILNIAKFITATLMLIVAFKQTKKQFTFNLILLFIYTYAFGGVITSLSSSVYYTNFGAVMTSKFSLEMICIVLIIITYIFELVVKHIKLKINTNNLIYDVTLTNNKSSIKINAYMDTGNFINHNGEPVLILDLKTYLKLTKTNLLNFLTTKTDVIKTGTVSGTNNLKIVSIDKIQIKKGKTTTEFNHPLVAINSTNCFKNTNYQALLSPLFL